MEWSSAEAVGARKGQWKSRRVINLDNVFRDHTYYWMNKDLVMPRIIRAINGGEDPWPEAGITTKKLKRHIEGVAQLVTLRLAMLGSIIGSVTYFLLNWRGFRTLWYQLWGEQPFEFKPAPEEWIPIVIILAVIGLYQTLRAWKFGDISGGSAKPS